MNIVAVEQPTIENASEGQLLAICFPKSRSVSYEPAVEIARQAFKYWEATTGKQLFHYAVFARNKVDAARALTVMRYIGTITGLQVYAGGKVLQERGRLDDILSCYLGSLACNDRKAHCFEIVQDDLLGDGRFIFPCSYLWQFRYSRRMADIRHPSKQTDQVQAAAVHIGCDWCPNFCENDFKKIK